MMLTRCPACQTAFRLGPEQLHARRGEVRCGHCFHPFNALDHEIVQRGQSRQTPPTPSASTAPPAPASPSPSARAPDPSLQPAPAAHATPEPDALAPALDFIILEEKPRPQSATPASASALNASEPPARASSPPPSAADTALWHAAPEFDFHTVDDLSPTTARAPALPEVMRSSRRPTSDATRTEPSAHPTFSTTYNAASEQPQAHEGPSTTYEPWAAASLSSAPQGTTADAQSARTPASPLAAPNSPIRPDSDPDPGPDPDSNAAAGIEPAQGARTDIKPAYIAVEHLDAKYGRLRKPASPLLRTLSTLATGVLGGVLAVQCIYLYRMEIARALPGLRPLMTQACAALGCEIPFPRDAGLIALDASELQSEPGKPGQYVLHATVNNRAEYAQTWPHLELTLTDAGDSPIARRVLTPEEWLPPDQRSPAQGAASFASHKAVSARIAFTVPDLAPTGYRVYIFYP